MFTLRVACCLSLLFVTCPAIGQSAKIPGAGAADVGAAVPGVGMAQVRRTPGLGGVNVGTLIGVQELNVDECTKLGCTVIDDKTCKAVKLDPQNSMQKRCVCPGGGNLCIDKAMHPPQ